MLITELAAAPATNMPYALTNPFQFKFPGKNQHEQQKHCKYSAFAVKGGEKVYHCGGGIVYHRHDEKGLNWEPGGVRSGAGVRSSGVSEESSDSSET